MAIEIKRSMIKGFLGEAENMNQVWETNRNWNVKIW